jgi:hypothetical protein
MDGTLSVIRLIEYIEIYHRPPEAKDAQGATTREISMPERRWRDIAQGKTTPRETTARQIARAAQEYCSRVQLNAHGRGTHGDARAERA